MSYEVYKFVWEGRAKPEWLLRRWVVKPHPPIHVSTVIIEIGSRAEPRGWTGCDVCLRTSLWLCCSGRICDCRVPGLIRMEAARTDHPLARSFILSCKLINVSSERRKVGTDTKRIGNRVQHWTRQQLLRSWNF